MKKIFFILILSLMVVYPSGVDALIVDNNNLTIEKGTSKNISLSTNVEQNIKEIQFTLVYTSYDVPAYFNIEAGLTDSNPNGIVHKIIFPEVVSGDIALGSIKIDVVKSPIINAAAINIHSAKATTESGEVINLTAQTINVTIGTSDETTKKEEKKDEKKEEPTKNLLEKIESNIVDIQLEEDVYEYSVKINDTIEELDLNAIPKDEKYKVEISNQKIDELENNQIIITVKNDDVKEEYKITVSKMEVQEVEIDDEEFETTYKYKGKWVVLIVIMSITLFIGLILTKKK